MKRNAATHNLFSVISAVFVFFAAGGVRAQEGGSGGFYEKYKRRQSQRFDLIGYLSDQKRIRAEQDAKWGYVKKRWPFEPDLALSYFKLGGDVERGSKLGDFSSQGGRIQFFMNGLLSDNDRRRAINIDLGFEGYHLSGAFLSSPGSPQTRWASTESGGGLLLRPFGRSSQDTGLLFKAGYAKHDTVGFWGASAPSRSFASAYYGGEAKLYLLPFLGARAEYAATAAREEPGVGGKVSRSRLTYGAFLEIFAIAVEAQIFESTYQLKPTGGGTSVTDSYKGMGLVGTVYF